jgi:hypothetical protein
MRAYLFVEDVYVRRCGYPLQPGDLVKVGVETGDGGDLALAAGQRDEGIIKVQFAGRGADEVKRLGVEIGYECAKCQVG